MAFVDECTVFARGGQRRQRLGAPAQRALQAPRRSRRGQRGRRRLGRLRGACAGCTTSPRSPTTPISARATAGRAGARSARGLGQDLVLPVPDGTVVFDEEGLLADLVGRGRAAVVARGGRGGRGNVAFAGPRNRVPRSAEPGEDGEKSAPSRRVAHRGRRRARGPAERGQVDAPLAAHRREAQDRQLPVHHAHAQPGRGRPGRIASSSPTSRASSRAPARAAGSGIGSCATSCGAARWCSWSTSPRSDARSADLATLRDELGGLRPEPGGAAVAPRGAKADLVDDPARGRRAPRPGCAGGLGDDRRGDRRPCWRGWACSRREAAAAAAPERASRTWSCGPDVPSSPCTRDDARAAGMSRAATSSAG